MKEKNNFFIHKSSFVDENVSIGNNTKIWHFSHIQSNVSIGKNCSLGQNVNVANNVKIGNNVKIQNNVSVYEGVELEDYVFCGPSMVFTNILQPRSEFPQRGNEFYTKTCFRRPLSHLRGFLISFKMSRNRVSLALRIICGVFFSLFFVLIS